MDEGWGPRAIPPFKGAVDFSWHFIDTLVENRFDPMICQEIEVDHGIQVPMELFWGRPEEWPVQGGADLRQRDPVPDPAAEPLLRDGPRPARGDRELRRATSGSSSSAPADCRTSFRAPAPASSTRRPTEAFLNDIAGDPGKLAGDVARGLCRDVRQRRRRADDVARHARRHGPRGGGAPHALLRAGLDDRRRHDRMENKASAQARRRRHEPMPRARKRRAE